MVRTYLKTAFRSLQRNRKHALLNILGLGIALGACIIIFLAIQFEYSHNKQLSGYNTIYHIVTKDVDADGEHYSSGVPFPVVPILRQNFTQYSFAELMKNYSTQVATRNSAQGLAGDKKFLEESGIFYGDPDLARMFDLKFIRGNAAVLGDVNSVAISKSVAEKYFGTVEDAMGQRLNYNNNPYDLQVSAIFKDVPESSDFPFRIISSYSGFVAHEGNGWPLKDWGSNTSNHQVYVQLPKGTNIATFNQQLALFEKKYNGDNKNTTRTHFLQPMSDIHFDDRFSTDGDHITSKASLYTLSFIGLLIMLMACINYINLSTALAITRGKEVGIRKVMGGNKAQLRMQVFSETALIVFCATGLGMFFAWLSLPYIKNIMVVQSRLTLFNTGSILFISVITFMTIFLSGLYPAFVMGRFKPVEAIKNKINTTKVGNISLRRVLVVLQFSFSQILIIATVIAISQMNFIRNADLGFTKDSVLTISINSDSSTMAKLPAFKNELLARKDVKKVSFSYDAPSSENSWQSNFSYDDTKKRDFNVNTKFGDQDYLDTYGIQLLAGKFYDASDTVRSYVVNETFLKKVGVTNPQDALGKMIRIGGGQPKPVTAVVRDFKVQSLRDVIPPIVLMPRAIYYGTAGIKLSGKNLLRTREEIQTIWNKYFPEYVFDASFLDSQINNFYKQEERLSLMYKIYALLAIFISCLGLYGLVSFMVVQKTKEVGIRKVLGASVRSILYLFSKEFTILVTIAFLLAAPIAWYLMHTWLQEFVYKIPMKVGFFLAAILISVLIAWLTVGYKSLKAAIANPVKSLRTE